MGMACDDDVLSCILNQVLIHLPESVWLSADAMPQVNKAIHATYGLALNSSIFPSHWTPVSVLFQTSVDRRDPPNPRSIVRTVRVSLMAMTDTKVLPCHKEICRHAHAVKEGMGKPRIDLTDEIVEVCIVISENVHGAHRFKAIEQPFALRQDFADVVLPEFQQVTSDYQAAVFPINVIEKVQELLFPMAHREIVPSAAGTFMDITDDKKGAVSVTALWMIDVSIHRCEIAKIYCHFRTPGVGL
jgi:hypothetical protein